jgi:hypothetical protein
MGHGTPDIGPGQGVEIGHEATLHERLVRLFLMMTRSPLGLGHRQHHRFDPELSTQSGRSENEAAHRSRSRVHQQDTCQRLPVTGTDESGSDIFRSQDGAWERHAQQSLFVG